MLLATLMQTALQNEKRGFCVLFVAFLSFTHDLAASRKYHSVFRPTRRASLRSKNSFPAIQVGRSRPRRAAISGDQSELRGGPLPARPHLVPRDSGRSDSGPATRSSNSISHGCDGGDSRASPSKGPRRKGQSLTR